jgi:hypothetical protein
VSGNNSGKRSGEIPGNMLGYGSGSDPVRRRVTRSGTTRVSNSGKVLSSDSGNESGTVSDKDLGKRLGKNSGKEVWQDKT